MAARESGECRVKGGGLLWGMPMMWTKENRGRYDRSKLRHPSDLTEEEWLNEVRWLNAVPEGNSIIRSRDPPEKQDDATLHSMSIAPTRWLARGAVLLLSMSIVFLTGVFVGASFIAGSSRPEPAEVSILAPIPAAIDAPSPGSARAGSYRSPEASTPEAAPAAAAVAETASPPSTSRDVLPDAASALVSPAPAVALQSEAEVPAASPMASNPAPQSERPALVAGAPPAPAELINGSQRSSETEALAPSPMASAPAPQSSQAAVVAAAAPASAETEAPEAAPVAPVSARATGPVESTLSTEQRQALLSRGDALFGAGDVTSARLFYQRGADGGDGTAALRLGETFDPAFLDRAHLGRISSDPTKAMHWYRRARDLGNSEVEILLKGLDSTQK